MDISVVIFTDSKSGLCINKHIHYLCLDIFEANLHNF